MFEFKDVISLTGGLELSACCHVHPDLAFFNGHFETMPIMPAAAQMMMLDALIASQNPWKLCVKGGKNIKFAQAIEPGETIKINIIKISETLAKFTLYKRGESIASKGELILMNNKCQGKF